ncbi:MAG: hypothetical protein WC596_02320 [Candidatus Shapirobacteria bacterium]
MSKDSNEIFKSRFGEIDPELVDLLTINKLNKGEFFRRVSKNKGRPSTHRSGDVEGEIGPIKLTGRHCRSRPRGSVKLIRNPRYFEQQEREPDGLARRYEESGCPHPDRLGDRLKAIREYRVTIGEILRGKGFNIRLIRDR